MSSLSKVKFNPYFTWRENQQNVIGEGKCDTLELHFVHRTIVITQFTCLLCLFVIFSTLGKNSQQEALLNPHTKLLKSIICRYPPTPPPVLVPHGGDRDAHDDLDDVAPDDHHELEVSK